MPRLINLTHMPSRTRRPPKRELPAWEPGRSARRILEILHTYRYVTTDLVGLIYEAKHGRGRWNVRHGLTKLWRYGFAERNFRPAEWGSSQYVYTLSVDGAHLIVDPKHWPDERRKVYNVAKQKTNYEHAIGVTLLHALWDAGSQEQSKLFHTVSVWQDKEGHKERVRNRFVAQVAGEDVRIDPDLTVLIAHQRRDFYRPYFFELERTHKNYERQRRRFQAYDYLLSKKGERVVNPVFERELGITPARGMAVFVAEDKEHAERLRGAAQMIVRADTELWFTSLEQLLEVKPRMRADGTPYLDRHGKPQAHEMPISPRAFFKERLLTALDGKSGKLVV